MNLVLYFTGRVIFLRSNGTESWMIWYSHSIMVRVTDLTWLFMMGVTWLFSSTRVRRWRTCSSRIVLSPTPTPLTIFSSIFSKPSPRSKYRVEIWISGKKMPISVWDFLRIHLQEFIICKPWRRQSLATKSEKWQRRKRCVINNTSQPSLSSSFYFFPPWYSHQYLLTSLWQKSPPWSFSCPVLPPSSS